ncbi:unnamed protein product [Cochlearia groenlandica]
MKNSSIDPKKNPKSTITSKSVAQISRTFELPLSGLRISSAAERPTDFVLEEIVLSPMVWRMLMALEVMGELNSIEVSVAICLAIKASPRRVGVVAFCSYIDHLNKGEDVVGNQTIEQLLELPSEWRSLEFLSNHLALERSAIWDCNMSESQRIFAPDPFEFFLAASGKLAEMGSSAHVSESQVRTSEVPRGGTVAADKRIAEDNPGDRMESRKAKVPPFSAADVLLSQRGEKLAETVGKPTKDHEAFVRMRERYEAEKKKGLDQLAAIDAKNKEISGPP